MTHSRTLALIVALSLVTGAFGQALMLSAAPHTRSVRQAPHALKRRLACVTDHVKDSLYTHLPNYRLHI